MAAAPVLSRSSGSGAPIALDKAIERNAAEVWEMLQKPDTHIFVAGMETMLAGVEKTLEGLAGPAEWARRKKKLVSGGRWSEVLY